MANITNTQAINFSNVQVRPTSDRLAQAYNRCVTVGVRWVALGSGQAALDQMQFDIRSAADKIIDAYNLSYWLEKNWFNGLSVLFPNDSSPVFDAGGVAQDPNRPLITGAIVTNVIVRSQQFQNWMLSVAGAFSPTFQVETATAAGTITGTGNATVTVTALGMTNSPKAISVAVVNADTAATWAGKVRTALAADVNVTAFFTVSGAGTSIILTAINAAANDATMNIALANGTSTGITAAPTSTNTTAGVAPRGGTSWLNTVLQVSGYGPTLIVLSDAGNFINRCSELKTNMEAGSNANLNTLLAAAVNPNL